MADLKAYILNCTLKKSPEPSHTEALINKIVDLYKPYGVQCEVERAVDYNIPFGVVSDLGAGDDWPKILKKIVAADIFIIGTSIWFGVRNSVSQLVIERLDGTYNDGDSETGQFPLYGTVGATVVTGNEDGAHDAAATTLFNLSHLGCVIPPQLGLLLGRLSRSWTELYGSWEATSTPTRTRRLATWCTTRPGSRG